MRSTLPASARSGDGAFSAGMTAVAAFALIGVLVAAAMPGRLATAAAVPPPATSVAPRGESAPS